MTTLFWHRRDLRLSDNLGLSMARQQDPQMVGLFCLDPQILQRNDVAPVRVMYLIGCLQELQKSYHQKGGQLVIVHGDPVDWVPRVAAILGVSGVFWNLDVEPYSQERDIKVRATLKSMGISVYAGWDQLLHAPADIYTGTGQPYTVFTPFCRNWRNRPKPTPVDPPLDFLGVDALTQSQLDGVALPTIYDLGYQWDGEFILSPGETAAENQLHLFCHQSIDEYQTQRNYPAHPGTSLLSPALKFGTVGIRTVWAATEIAWHHCRSDESRESIQGWQTQLAWREFYQHALYHFPQLADGPYRSIWHQFPWEGNVNHFQAWCEGRTGYPIVDAAMRQLNTIGWMHNRCRMIVASFLTKDLIIDWRWGEQYFMQHLIDGDLAANNGGWQWSASSGMDPRPLRIFNPHTQTQKFDAEGEYIRQWVPELRNMEAPELVTGKISPLDRDRCGYPHPIVDHHHQQKRFKQLYSTMTSSRSSP